MLEILTGSGYDGASGTGVVLGIIGDTHISMGTEYPHFRTDKWHDGLIAELNSLSPMMTDVVIAGDLISYHSMSPGIPRYRAHEVWARLEYELTKEQISRLDTRFRVWAVPGNHDTDAYETDAELWREMLGIPAYRKAILGGVPVFFLNSGNGGMLDPGQLAWFRSEARGISSEQEIVIVMHHPVFFAVREEAAMKRVLCEMFGGRKGRIWIASGHGHRFEDERFSYQGTEFVQMEVTAANPLASSDGRSPGYIVLALQDGRVISSLYRSLKEEGFQGNNPVPKRVSKTVSFQFDSVQAVADCFEEGLYDPSGRVVSFSGVHVGSYIAYLKNITFRVNPERYFGRLSELVLAGTMPSTVQPRCQISRTGENGTWESLVFPTNRGEGLFRIAIPESFRDAAEFKVNVETGLTGNVTGFTLSGWALAADRDSLSLYERWLQRVYGHLRKEAATEPLASTPGTAYGNLVNFAFGLGVAARPGVGEAIPAGVISGLPRYDRARRAVLDFRFARRRAESLPGLKCVVERSTDLRSWEPLEGAALVVRKLDSTWEEVSVSRLIVPGRREYLRVGVVEDVLLGSGFGQWKSAAFASVGRGGDLNSNGTEDLLEFALKLDSVSGGLARPDSGREAIDFRFTRRREDSLPGAKCVVERSVDLRFWDRLEEADLMVRRLDSVWEEVVVSRIIVPGRREFLRVGVFEDVSLGTGFGRWRSEALAQALSNKDVNRNGIEDLLEYAFDLGSVSGGLRRYDPGREGEWGGVPYYGVRRAAVSVLVFPRMKASANSGVGYALEWSSDLDAWNPVPAWLMEERVLRSEGDWDEVEVSILDDSLPKRFYRVAVSEA